MNPSLSEDERLVPMRLQKFLARAGVASRRGSEDLMTAGRVTVNGVVATELGTKVDPEVDVVAVDGVRVEVGAGKVYLILNKPDGYITTMDDPQGRPCVAQLVPTGRFPGLFAVGRLDKDTTGVLLFTTDGDLAARLLHPSTHVDKTYHVRVNGILHEDELQRLREGIELDDGPTSPCKARLLRKDEASDVIDRHLAFDQSCAEVIIHEGRKRQVKRMFGAIGHPVLRLNRVSFGPITADGLELGRWRLLSAAEVESLRVEASNPRFTGTERIRSYYESLRKES